jgi:hypothetical protein
MEITEAFHQVDQLNADMAQTSGTFTVTPTNVLAAAKIIENQVLALQDKLDAARFDLLIEAPGTDDVSTKIAPAWNDLLLHKDDSYANRVQDYVRGLTNLAQQCAESAKTYGYTDEQIAAALGTGSAGA